jgi:lipid-A-disaccharide synthase|tara:strand:- start:19336 stop:20490 length:1155 start_codon:yes stop_codon:yes gene_type:complete
MSKPLFFGIVAGEKSGDILGASLILEMRKRHPDVEFVGIGGDDMIAAGCRSMFEMDRLSVMGFVEPLGRLPELFGIKRQLREYFIANPPLAFIGIDAPDFNLRLESELHNVGIKTVHYVGPSVWAYRAKRIVAIKKAVDLMLTLFPFETQIYKDHDIKVACVGHPLADEIGFTDAKEQTRSELGIAQDAKVIALMPGSRSGEITRLAPIFFGAAIKSLQRNPSLRFLIPCSSADNRRLVGDIMRQLGLLSGEQFCLLDDSRQTMSAADFVVMASGTATLEALLLRRPMVICYKLAALTFAIASKMVKIPNVALPNLLAGKLLVPEYLQGQVTVDAVSDEIIKFVSEPESTAAMLKEFTTIHKRIRLGASVQAVNAIESLVGVKG